MNTISVGTKIPKEMLVLFKGRSIVVKVTFKKIVTLDLDRLLHVPRSRISMSDIDWRGLCAALANREWQRVSPVLTIAITGNPDEKRKIAEILIEVAEKIESIS